MSNTRVAIIIHNSRKSSKLSNIGNALQGGVEKQGYQVDLIQSDELHQRRLTPYSYIIVGTTALSLLGGKIDLSLNKLLEHAGSIGGTRAAAFLVSPGLRSMRTLRALMALMEGNGLYLKNSAVLSGPEDAEYFGKKLHVEKTR